MTLKFGSYTVKITKLLENYLVVNQKKGHQCTLMICWEGLELEIGFNMHIQSKLL